MAQRDWFEKDFYRVLGVPENASKDEVKRAYRKLAQRYHPDANEGDAKAEQRFKEISEAHAVLSNEEKRREYDQFRRLAASGGGSFGFRPPGSPGEGGVRVNIGDLFGGGGGDAGIGDLFEEAFGFSARPRRGQDMETEVYLSFEEAVQGTTIELSGGTKVRIPPGVKDGARIRVAGRGGPGPQGAPSGDLYVRVQVTPHPLFKQEDNGNLRIKVPVTFPEAALGTKIQVPTLDGSVTVKVPAGTRAGKTLRVKGRGAPRRSGGSGDLLVTIEVEVPQRLTKQEKEALERFADAHKANPRAYLDDLTKRDAGTQTNREAS